MKTRKQQDQEHFDEGGSIVIVLREKHSDEYFACHTLEELSNAILETLWNRFHEGYWYGDIEKPNEPSITSDEAYALPEDPTSKVAIQEHVDYEREMREYERAMEELNSIKEALKTRNTLLALGILESRSDYEYEEIRVKYTTPAVLPKGNLLIVKPKHLEGSTNV